MSRNSSMITADRATHLKIVVVALLASVTVMIVGIAARPQPILATGTDLNTIR
jgi:hypothetical protein